MRTLVQLVLCVLGGALLALIGWGAWRLLGWWSLIVPGVVLVFVISVAIYAIAKSWGSVDKNERALKSWGGELVGENQRPEDVEIYRPGRVFLPYIPLYERIFGVPFCSLVRFPTKPMNFKVQGTKEHLIWSKDKQLLYVNFSGYVIFPYEEADSLVRMAEAEVPTTEAELDVRIESEIVAGLRDVMAKFTHIEAIERSNLTAIQQESEAFFLRSTGWFARSGIFGNNVANSAPGAGEVVVRVETITLEPKLHDVIGQPVVVDYEIKVAEKQITLAEKRAQADAQMAAVVPKAFQLWLDTPAGKDAGPEQKKDMLEFIRQQALSDDGNYKEVKSGGRTEIDISSGGQPVDPSFAGIIGAAEAFFGAKSRDRGNAGGQQSGGGNKPKKRKDDRRGNMTDADFKNI